MRSLQFVRVMSAAALCAMLTAVPVAAQDSLFDAPSTPGATASATTTPLADAVANAAQLPRPGVLAPPAQKRPAALMGLYASFVALQIGDAVTTFSALGNGGVEANPLMKGATSNKGAMFAVKAGTSLGTIYLTEKLWKKNRAAAIASMVVMNGAYVAIVAHNAKIARGQ